MKPFVEKVGGSTTEYYGYGNDLLHIGSGEFDLYDDLGSTRIASTSSQTVGRAMDYDAFGNGVYSSGSNDYVFRWRSDLNYEEDAAVRPRRRS